MEVRAPDAARQDFAERIGAVAKSIGDRPLEPALAQWLNANYSVARPVQIQPLARSDRTRNSSKSS